MKIFFTGSVRGGRAQQPQYVSIVTCLKKYGTVFSQHVQDEALSEYGETNLTSAEILTRERNAIEKSDLIVADVTTLSLGVGYFIAYATSLGKRVIALYRGDDTLKLSAIIKGDANVEVCLYKSYEDIEEILEKAFDRYRSHAPLFEPSK